MYLIWALLALPLVGLIAWVYRLAARKNRVFAIALAIVTLCVSILIWPISVRRHAAFLEEFNARGLDGIVQVLSPVTATAEQLLWFHTPGYVQRVQTLSKTGAGFLDFGDTPAFPGVFEAASAVVGCAVDAVDRIMRGELARAFIPIGGLQHAARDQAAGFCVFNDCGVAIQMLLDRYHLTRVAYVDIDAHHGDGVFYAFKEDPRVWFADIHEDGRFLYPGTGTPEQTGIGTALGTKDKAEHRHGTAGER